MISLKPILEVFDFVFDYFILYLLFILLRD